MPDWRGREAGAIVLGMAVGKAEDHRFAAAIADHRGMVYDGLEDPASKSRCRGRQEADAQPRKTGERHVENCH
jgi:hypothetical protein